MDNSERRPLLGPSLVMLDYLCRTTRLDLATLQSLVESGRLQGVEDEAGRALGFYANALPTADELRALGVTGVESYRPEEFISLVDAGEDDEDDDDGGAHESSGFTLTWRDISNADG